MTDGEPTIRVLFADDHAVVREGLRALITSAPGLELAGEARDGVEAVELARSTRPDVILLDMMMPRLDGLGAIKAIKEHDPEAKIVVLTSFGDDDKVFPAIKAGALGYLLKDSSPAQLLRAIEEVSRGESSLHPTIARKLIQELKQPQDLPLSDEPLSEREVEVLQLLAEGRSNQEIADKLFISERTIRNHVSAILGKLHLANRTQAALYALRKGIATL
jgi:NarL family two-component system response regulator LiaR